MGFLFAWVNEMSRSEWPVFIGWGATPSVAEPAYDATKLDFDPPTVVSERGAIETIACG